MEMLVETFEQTESLPNGETEGNEEAVRLIEELDLRGQKEFIHPQTKERTPYREMTRKESRVYETLFPQRMKISEYRVSFIPLRILRVAAHAKNLGCYIEIEIWGGVTKPTDPILVGVVQGAQNWEKTYHILARWGEALASFEELFVRAIKVKRETVRFAAEKELGEVKNRLSSLDNDVALTQWLSGEYVVGF